MQIPEKNANDVRTGIQLDSLNEVKTILASPVFTSDEKIHLIESRIIVGKAKRAELDNVSENTGTRPATRAAGCTTCEPEAPVGQMTIFDFLGATSVR